MSAGVLRSLLILVPISLISAGCGSSEIDTTHGRSRGASINGTGAFFELLRQRGNEVRTAIRATDTLASWSNVVVRFASHPGPPDQKEAKWLFEWLMAAPGRKVVYIPRDFDSEPEFWEAVLAAQPSTAKADDLDRIKKKRDQARSWINNLPSRPKDPAKPADWFAVDTTNSKSTECKLLEGPWSEDVDAKGAAVNKHETFKVENDETVLLSGDGSPLVMTWNLENGSQVLAIANASFLLNGSLLNRARRPLTMQVADWIGSTPLNIASLEGRSILVGERGSDPSSPFHLFSVPPFGWIASHMLIFLCLLALSFAVRLGRARPEPASGVERPAAHPEALGALLAKTGRADVARFLLESYRRWRHPTHAAGRSAPAHLPSR